MQVTAEQQVFFVLQVTAEHQVFPVIWGEEGRGCLFGEVVVSLKQGADF